MLESSHLQGVLSWPAVKGVESLEPRSPALMGSSHLFLCRKCQNEYRSAGIVRRSKAAFCSLKVRSHWRPWPDYNVKHYSTVERCICSRAHSFARAPPPWSTNWPNKNRPQWIAPCINKLSKSCPSFWTIWLIRESEIRFLSYNLLQCFVFKTGCFELKAIVTLKIHSKVRTLLPAHRTLDQERVKGKKLTANWRNQILKGDWQSKV